MEEKHEVKRRKKRDEKTGGKKVQVYGGTDVPAYGSGPNGSMEKENKKGGKAKKIALITAVLFSGSFGSSRLYIYGHAVPGCIFSKYQDQWSGRFRQICGSGKADDR